MESWESVPASSWWRSIGDWRKINLDRTPQDHYHKAIKINVIKFWKSILSILPSYIPPVIFGVFIMAFYNFSGLFDYLFFVCLYTIIYCISVYFFGLNANEKEYIKAPIKKFLNNKEIKK